MLNQEIQLAIIPKHKDTGSIEKLQFDRSVLNVIHDSYIEFWHYILSQRQLLVNIQQNKYTYSWDQL